jgi:hypothetical protein
MLHIACGDDYILSSMGMVRYGSQHSQGTKTRETIENTSRPQTGEEPFDPAEKESRQEKSSTAHYSVAL